VSEQIPLARPELGEREEALVLEAIRSGRLSIGPLTERFERDFAAWIGVEEAVAVSSGTAALHLGVRAVGWGSGDAVLTSPLSFVASANCLLYEGAEPRFCDIDPVTLNIDPEAAAAAIDGAAGLLPVHIFGYPADTLALEALAGGRGIPILEDACQAIGAIHADGRYVGSRGNPTAFAFYANKQLTTAEGGMLVTAAGAAAQAARSERNQGRSPSMEVMEHVRLGFNYRINELEAALGVAQLERIDDTLVRRAAVAAAYQQRLAEVEGLTLPCPDRGGERRSWFVYVVQLPEDADREAVIAGLAAAGIAAKPYLPCIHLQPYYRERFGFRGGEFPVAESVAARSLALPFFTAMTGSEVDRVCEALRAQLGVAP
jgi:perosamine synthetase